MDKGNAFGLIAGYIRAAKKAGFDKATIDAKVADATSGDYNHLCKVLGY